MRGLDIVPPVQGVPAITDDPLVREITDDIMRGSRVTVAAEAALAEWDRFLEERAVAGDCPLGPGVAPFVRTLNRLRCELRS